MVEKPKLNATGAKELDKCEEQFKSVETQVKDMTMDRMNLVPKLDYEGQTKMSQADIAKSPDIYLKPRNYVASQERFNEKFRRQYEYDKIYVQFTAENSELKGEDIPVWTKPYPGCPAEFWKVLVNRPVWGPRYLMEQLQRKQYHVLEMTPESTGYGEGGQYYGKLSVVKTTQRLDARETSSRRSISMFQPT